MRPSCRRGCSRLARRQNLWFCQNSTLLSGRSFVLCVRNLRPCCGVLELLGCAWEEEIYAVLVLGYCHQPHRIIPLIESGCAKEIVNLGGNFVAVHTIDHEVWIVTSPYGVVPYFYHEERFA